METQPSDEDLVRRIARGERDAEVELCRRMGPRVRLYGLRHARELCDDLVQQVLLTTLQALRAGRLRDPCRLASFVLGTCRMTLLDLRRGAQRKERIMQQWAATLPRWTEPPPPNLDRDRLARCLQALAERERSVIVMSFYDDQAGQDIAGSLGLSPANVRVIRHRALHLLRRCMDADQRDPTPGVTP
jgi:RNA polymerase sigma-70 factor (ECF subfamily)